MCNDHLTEIKEKIAAQHEGDKKQLEVIFSDDLRLIVEAPAGYGKTTTMISRIAYLFAVGKIPNPKRILGLTFSVNAALKIKREVAGKLPSLIGTKNSPVTITEKATLTNFHGFCKGILKKYGYLLSPILRKDINLFRAVGDSEIDKQYELKRILTADEFQCLKNMEIAVKESRMPGLEAIHIYNEIVMQKLLPLDYVTHNAIVLFVLDIFDKYTEVKKFYQNFYSLIVVDEFQDTNCIAWELLKSLISDNTHLLFLGDPLQRIYGFIGALPNIMSDAVDQYGMSKMVLEKNYRFRNNSEMLKLDKNIRANATNCFVPSISDDAIAQIPGFWGVSQQDEANQVVTKVQTLIDEGAEKIALLFRGRGKNAEVVESELSSREISYFYGMFTDEDTEYIKFHNACQSEFIKRFGKKKSINKQSLLSFSDNMKTLYSAEQGKATNSLLKLLDALMQKVTIDYADLLPEDKYALLLDVFENRQLKQAMEYVDSNVILSTVHGAKGLEWDYVILGDMERWVFPGYYTCNACANKFTSFTNNCCKMPTPLPAAFKDTILDELSVFYVGVTRAKKQVYLSASAKRLDFNGNEKNGVFSCMASIPGLKLIKA